MECKFASLTVEQLTYLVSANIDSLIVTYDEMRKIEDVFDLGNDDTDLMAVRNSVVDTLGALTTNAVERGNFKLFQQLQANMSGITATIDHVMMVRGFC